MNRNIKLQYVGPRFLIKLDNHLSKVYLKMSEKVLKEREEIKYKLTNPEGFKADSFIRWATKKVNRLIRRYIKSERLSKSDIRLHSYLSENLQYIFVNKIGKNYTSIPELLRKLECISPEEVSKQVEQQIDELFIKANSLLNEMEKKCLQQD